MLLNEKQVFDVGIRVHLARLQRCLHTGQLLLTPSKSTPTMYIRQYQQKACSHNNSRCQAVCNCQVGHQFHRTTHAGCMWRLASQVRTIIRLPAKPTRA